MTEQELKNFCVKALARVPIPPDKQECVRVATDFAERLYIADYFSKEDRTNFIKNELCSHFKLTDDQTNKIIRDIDFKESYIKDKLQIKNFKNALIGLLIFENDEFFKCNNILEVAKIVAYIKTNYTFNNQDIFRHFIQEDLCRHFELTQEEQQEIMKGV